MPAPTIIYTETPHLHTACVTLMVRGGPVFEERAVTNGLTHFLEHMLFRGSEAYPGAYDAPTAAARLGTTINAATAYDRMWITLQVRPAHLAAAVQLLADFFRWPVFADIELEREIVLEEIGGDFDRRGGAVAVTDVCSNLLYGGHPAGRPIAGTPGRVRAFVSWDLVCWYRRLLESGVVISVAGPAPAEAAYTARQAFAFLAELPHSALETTLDVAPPNLPIYQHVREATAEAVEIAIGFYAPCGRPSAEIGLLLVEQLLDGGGDSLLHRRVTCERGLAYDVGASLSLVADHAVLFVTGSCSQGKEVALLEQMLAAVAAIPEMLRDVDAVAGARERILLIAEATADGVVEIAHEVALAALHPGRATRVHLNAVRADGIDWAEQARVAFSTLSCPAVVSRGRVHVKKTAAMRALVEAFRL